MSPAPAPSSPAAIAAATAAPKLFAPGIYFGLDETTYHKDPSLGSSNIRDLWYSPTDYWWGSVHNPDREEDEDESTAAQERGKAMHKLVLEGEAAFDQIYVRGPSHGPGMSPSEKGAATKAGKAKAAALGKTMLAGVDYDRTVIAGAMIARNPHLAPAFKDGLPEVSLFWREDVDGMEVPCKARIDWLKPRGLGDLKSITSWRRIEFKRACREAITNSRYDMQAAHYMRGRAHVAKFVADSAVHGNHDKALLKKVAAEKGWAFQFIFFQASRSPITHSVIITPHEANPLYQQAERDVSAALASYRENVQRFGLSTPWLTAEPPTELAIEEMPAWYGRK